MRNLVAAMAFLKRMLAADPQGTFLDLALLVLSPAVQCFAGVSADCTSTSQDIRLLSNENAISTHD